MPLVARDLRGSRRALRLELSSEGRYALRALIFLASEDQILLRSEVDHGRRLIRYRGRPQICNHCPAKADCTDSDDGREVVRAIDPWPHSEAGRFHRGISLAVALIAGLIVSAEALHNHTPWNWPSLEPDSWWSQ